MGCFVVYLTRLFRHLFVPSLKFTSGPYGAPMADDRIIYIVHAIPTASSAMLPRLLSAGWSMFGGAFALRCLMLALCISFVK